MAGRAARRHRVLSLADRVEVPGFLSRRQAIHPSVNATAWARKSSGRRQISGLALVLAPESGPLPGGNQAGSWRAIAAIRSVAPPIAAISGRAPLS